MGNFAVNQVNNWNNLVTKHKTIFVLAIVLIALTFFFTFLSGIRWGVYGGIAIAIGLILAWAISLGITALTIKGILKSINFDKVSNGKINKEDIQIIKPMIFGFVMLIVYILLASINEIIILIIRRPITRKMKQNKALNKSNALWRLGGGIIAIMGAFPMAVLAANPVGLVSVNNKTINWNDKVTQKITFNYAKGISKYTPGLLSLAKIGADYSKNGKEKDSIIGSIEYYFQQFFDQKNYVFRGKTKDPNYHTGSNPNMTADIDVEFWFGLKKEVNSTVEYEKFPRFEDGTVKDVLNGFLQTDESFDMFLRLLDKIAPKVDTNGISDLKKFEDALTEIKNAGTNIRFNLNFSNVKLHIADQFKLHIANAKYRNLVKMKVFDIANKVLKGIIIPKSVAEFDTLKAKIGYILAAIVDGFIVE